MKRVIITLLFIVGLNFVFNTSIAQTQIADQVQSKSSRHIKDSFLWVSKNPSDIVEVYNPAGQPVIVTVHVTGDSPSPAQLICNQKNFNISIGSSFTCVTSADVKWSSTFVSGSRGTYDVYLK